tara:strand:+ start:235 stop:441 length:207 start_codon:yes stop_codon:yes gene_type:complete
MKNFIRISTDKNNSIHEWININYIIRVFHDIEEKDSEWSTAIVVDKIGLIYSNEPVEQIVKKIKEAQQ